MRAKLLAAVLTAYAAAALVNLTAPFLRHQEAVLARYGSYARNFNRLGFWETRFGMLQVGAEDLSVFGDWRDHYYPQRPPLSAVALSLWTRVFGDGEASLRLHLILVGLLTIAAFDRVARRLLGGVDGLLATALFALTPLFLYFSLIAPHYAWALLFSLAMWAAALEGRFRWMWVFLALACFTDWPAYFAVGALALHLGGRRRWLLAGAAVAGFGLNLLHRWWLDPSGRYVSLLLSVGVHHAAPTGVTLFGYILSEMRELGVYVTAGLGAAALAGTVVLVRRRQWAPLLFALFGLEEILFARQAYEHDYLTFFAAPFPALAGAVGLRAAWERSRPLAVGVGLLIAAQAVWIGGDRLTRRGGNEGAWLACTAIREATSPRDRVLLAMDSPLTEYYADRYVATMDRAGGVFTLRPELRIDGLPAFIEAGAPGFEVVVMGVAERVSEEVGFLCRAGVQGARLADFGFYEEADPLRQALRKRAPEELRGAFAFYRLGSPGRR